MPQRHLARVIRSIPDFARIKRIGIEDYGLWSQRQCRVLEPNLFDLNPLVIVKLEVEVEPLAIWGLVKITRGSHQRNRQFELMLPECLHWVESQIDRFYAQLIGISSGGRNH